jgi:hypothetical protein
MLKLPFAFKPPIPASPLIAGVQWVAGLFALGFVLGTVRVLLTAPLLGEWPATLLELPVMLWAGWQLCARTIRRHQLSPAPAARLVMGLVFLVLLLAAEQALGLWGFGRTLAQQAEAMRAPPALAGLATQLFTAAFPMLQRHRPG